MTVQLQDGFLQIFDVDHGQCALLTLPTRAGTKRVMIDCGHAVNFNSTGKPWYPGQHLQSLGITWIDLLIATNYDEDHMSGFPDLLARKIGIGCILGNPTVSPETIVHLKTEDGMGNGIRALAQVLAARRDIRWPQVPPTIQGLELSYFWNPYPHFDDENNLSLVALLNIHGLKFLFPGDMEKRGFDNMLRTCPLFGHAVAGVDVLIASHYGRENGICPDMFDVHGCSPSIVVISDDYKQHGTQETTGYYSRKAKGIAWFRNGGARYVLTTRSDKEICFSFNNSGCRVW
jgi:beta-lactamase superfamily II metal-dependent hydrolase